MKQPTKHKSPLGFSSNVCFRVSPWLYTERSERMATAIIRSALSRAAITAAPRTSVAPKRRFSSSSGLDDACKLRVQNQSLDFFWLLLLLFNRWIWKVGEHSLPGHFQLHSYSRLCSIRRSSTRRGSSCKLITLVLELLMALSQFTLWFLCLQAYPYMHIRNKEFPWGM